MRGWKGVDARKEGGGCRPLREVDYVCRLEHERGSRGDDEMREEAGDEVGYVLHFEVAQTWEMDRLIQFWEF